MAMSQIQIKQAEFQKALDIPEVRDFILEIERFLVDGDATEETLRAISDEVIKYSDDAEFDVDTLKDVLDKHHIESELIDISEDSEDF